MNNNTISYMNNTKVFLIFILVIFLAMGGVLGFQYWKANEKNKVLEAQISSLEQEKSVSIEKNSQLESDVAALKSTNQEILTQVESLKKKSSSICTKNNSCKFRTPGSGFKCDRDGKYSSHGDHWCECTIDCEVNIQ